MLATILFQLLATGGMALLGWWLCFDEDTPRVVAGSLESQHDRLLIRQRRSAA